MRKAFIVFGMLGLILCAFTGCATDRFYKAGKTVYIAGKKVIIANWSALPKNVQEKLQAVDKIATRYDKARSVIKPAIEEAVKQTKKSDAKLE